MAYLGSSSARKPPPVLSTPQSCCTDRMLPRSSAQLPRPKRWAITGWQQSLREIGSWAPAVLLEILDTFCPRHSGRQGHGKAREDCILAAQMLGQGQSVGPRATPKDNMMEEPQDTQGLTTGQGKQPGKSCSLRPEFPRLPTLPTKLPTTLPWDTMLGEVVSVLMG